MAVRKSFSCFRADSRFGGGASFVWSLWVYITSWWPNPEGEHRNHDKANYRWDNLWEAARSQNCGNTRAHGNNKSGLKGDSWDEK
jgi:hypothetical protein